MKPVMNKANVEQEPREGFYMGATIAVILLFLLFIGASFYLAVSSYMEV